MTQEPSNATPAAKPASTHWKRLVAVWVALAISTTVVAVVGWAALPLLSTNPTPTRPASPSLAAVEAIVWPRDFPPSRRWRFIVIHHSATPSATLDSIDRGHTDRGFTHGAGYHFLINNGISEGTSDGQITPTVRWLEQLDGAHTKAPGRPEYNAEGIGICLIGHFEKRQPTAMQMAALQGLVAVLRTRYDISLERIVGHREVADTECPGRLFPMDDFLLELRQSALKGSLASPRRGAEGE